MTFKALSPNVSVSPQIARRNSGGRRARFPLARSATGPMARRPDQPNWSEIAAAAEAAGLETRHIPVPGDAIEAAR